MDSINANGSPEYVEYAKFMACTTANYLETKAKYDPMAMFLSSKLRPVPYQLYDFSKLIEEYRKNGNIRALIAYETGLGKTILVGMIIKELISKRFTEHTRSKRILILTPPQVLDQFKDEMKKRFNLEFEEFNTKQGTFGDMVIASYDTVKREPWIEHLKDQVWDIVIVDEYHKFNSQNQRGELIQVITEKTKSLIALTATPHDGRRDRYGFRLNMISIKPMIIRRTKKRSLDLNNQKLFDQHLNEKKEAFSVTDEETLFYDRAGEYARKRFAESGAGPLVAIVIGRAVSSSIHAGLGMLTKRKTNLLKETFTDDENDEDIQDLKDKLNQGNELSTLDIDRILGARPENREALEDELRLIDPVIHVGQQLIAQDPIDSKGKYLLNLISEKLKENRKCLIFTGFLKTLDYLRGLLEAEGYEILEISGRVSMDDRNWILEKFSSSVNHNIIIGTDAMGESLNLQAASVEINYEVPWSPVSYIQRVGRIWRLGQKEKELFIHNFLPQFEVERRVMEVILDKIKTINEDFGEVGLSVFGEELGSVDTLVRQAYTEEVLTKIDQAEAKSRASVAEIMDQIMGSMELPRVVNVEDLQRNNLVNIDDAFSEGDMKKFLDHLKDAGVAVGNYSDGVLAESTYYVSGDGFTPVERLSLEDEGIKKAISRCKSLQPSFGFHFSYNKEMSGILSVFRVRVNEEIVYEEPVLVTEDGVLTYQGIVDLFPSFTETYSTIRFKSLAKYKAELEKTWFDKTQEKINEKLDFMGQLISEEVDPIRKTGLKAEFKKMLAERPKSCSVEEGAEICSVKFKSETAWLGNEEVEKFGMLKTTEYYESNGYIVTDVHLDTYKGYDIECRRGNSIFRVEVKGLRGSRYPLMTPNEHSKAVLYRESYILFIVRMGVEDFTMYAIPDPVFNEVEITEIMKPFYQVKGFSSFQLH